MESNRLDEAAPLFGTVPPGLFRLLVGRAKHFYAELLAHLAEDPFGHTGEIATRKRVIEVIAEFIDRRGRAGVVDALSLDTPIHTGDPSHVIAYNRLIETAWLVEYRDRYRRVVDFDPAARLVLHTLLDIQNGRVRAYGGAVLNVLTLLQSVEGDPRGRALNVREAAIAARGFMNHLRTVAGTLRRVEALIMAQPTAARLVRQFVTEFIEALVVQDYRNLQARESPYRFRGQILEVGEHLLDDDRVVETIAEGWVAGGIAKTTFDARGQIIADLREIMRVFGGIDDHVADIETTTFRIERRMTNVVRFSDRLSTVSSDRILHAMALLRETSLGDADEVEVRHRLQLHALPLSPTQFYSAPRRRFEAPEREIRVQAPDPALLRYLEAVDAFTLRTMITAEQLEAYAQAALGDKDTAEAEDFPVEDVDQFMVFERLHEVGLGTLSERYVFEPVAGRIDNGWVERQAFVVRRKEVANG